MEERDNETGNGYHEPARNGSGTTVVIFLAILAVLLALGGALLLRQLLSAKHDSQVAASEIRIVNDEKELLLIQLDELEERYSLLETTNQELETQLAAERRRVRQLRAQLHGEGGTGDGAGVEQYRERIEELEAQLETYRNQLEIAESENNVLTGENAQIRETLAQTSARNQQLESRTEELEEQVDKASILTISNLEGTALRERRRGDEPTDRAKRTDKIRICFTINENLVANPGNYDFFIRLINPLNQVMTLSPDNTLEFEGETIQYSLKRTVNFQNSSQEVCMVWDQDERFEKGYYNIVVFSEGREVGYKLFQLD